METLTSRIIGCPEDAPVHELRKAGFFVEQQVPFPVLYDGAMVGDYISDIVVERRVIMELKAISTNLHPFASMCTNYLKAAKLPVCLLINLGKPSLEWQRFVGEAHKDAEEPI